MHLGSIYSNNLIDKYLDQQKDFLKLWIFTEGPEAIVKQASDWLGITPPTFHHKCLYCAFLYNSPEIRKTINENYLQVKDRIIEKYEAQCIMQKDYLTMNER